MAVQVARAAFKTISEDALMPDLCIQVLSEQLAPFLLLTITANNHVVVVHRIQCLTVALAGTNAFPQESGINIHWRSVWGIWTLPMVVKLKQGGL